MFERFIARQAILKDNLTLFAYDLQFCAEDSGAGEPSRCPAAYLVDASTLVFRWESLTANALTIVALGEQELLSGVALILPRAKAVIAIADSVPCTAEVVLACESLKTVGYRLALAGWTGRKEQGPLAAMADFLLVDMRRLAAVNERETMGGQADGKTALIAQNVDSWEEHKRARNLGVRFFQGDFFLTPQLFQARDYRHAAQRNAPAAGNSEGSPGPGANRGGGAR